MTNTVRVPLPNRGDGYKVLRGLDGRMTTVPMRRSELALYATDRMAMDATFDPNARRDVNASTRANTRPTAPGTWDNDPDDVDDLGTRDSEGYNLEDKIRQLLEGKLDDADIQMLIQLIQPDDTAPAATDRRLPRPGGMARDSRITPTMRQALDQGVVRRAAAKRREVESLMKRFPALKNARVIG